MRADGRIALNARFFSHRPTGMQRYAIELSNRLNGDLDPIRPSQPLKGGRGHLWEQFYLPAACRGRLLWSPNNTGPIATSRQVCTVHDLIPLDHPEWFNPQFSGWYRWLMPKLAARVRHVIAISEFTKQRTMELLGVEARRITVVPNGVDPQFRPASADEVSNVRRKLGIAVPRYLLSVGSLEPRKNVGRLLQAWERIEPNLPDDVQLVVAGAQASSLVFAGVQFERLPPRVQFTGYVEQEDLPVLYSGALAFVYPSLYEGFGLPPLEAMACGTPVVTSDGTSLPEVVGGAAVLVDPNEVESIAAGIRRVVADEGLRARLREAGLARAAELTWERTARLTRQVLLENAN
jgi:glycosyltransferase involved in cell wall biosynthesis